jgi:glycosyltransferase involved in cell wall biosynthesis
VPDESVDLRTGRCERKLKIEIGGAKRMPKVSVIIPSFNHEKYVRAAIESVLTQSFQDFEIVVTDDGSRDRTAEEVAAIGDKRISLTVLPRNYGGCIASNASIRRANGQYLAWLASDDLFLPGKLEKQARFLDENPGIGGVVSWPVFVDENGQPFDAENYKDNILTKTRNSSRHAWLRHFFFHGNALCSSTLMIRRSCYDRVGLHNPALAQLADFEMWVRLLGAYEIHLIEEPLVGFRIREGAMNASALRPEVIVRDQWEWRKVLEQYLYLDDELLVKAFPELAGYQVGALRTGIVRKLASKALQRYIPRDTVSDSPVSAGLTDSDPRRSLRWGLAQLALGVGKPSHILFAFDTMYDMLGKAADESIYREFIGHTGIYDPLGSLFNIPQNRKMETWAEFAKKGAAT